MYKVLAYLKDCKNPHYQNVIMKCMFCPREFLKEDVDVLEHVQACHLNAQAMDSTKEDQEISGDERDDVSHEVLYCGGFNYNTEC